MTDLLTDDYKIAVNYNNTAGLTLISSIVPSTDEAFNLGEIVLGLALYNPGIAKIRGTGLTTRSGFKSTRWNFGYWTLLQYEYLQTTYCGGLGNYSGFVTIRTRTGNTAFANFNAIIEVPTPDQLEWQFPKYVAPYLAYKRMVAL